MSIYFINENEIESYKKDIIDIFYQISRVNEKKHNSEYILSNIEKIKQSLVNDSCYVIGKIEHNRLQGFIWCYFLDGNNLHISFFGVNEEFRNSGIGSSLLESCFKRFNDVNRWELYVNRHNSAVDYYRKFGFNIEKENNDLYFMVKNNLPTPYFELDEKELLQNLNQLKNALKDNFSNYIIGYSFKTNSLPYVCNFIKNEGCYAEVVSYDEYELAKYLGYDDKKIIYNGPMKNKESFLRALENGSIVNVETIRELRWLNELRVDKSYEIGLRINFDIEKMCPNEATCGNEGGRFGFCIHNNEFENALKIIEDIKNVSLAGIHLHTSSKTRSINIYKAISDVAVKIIDKYKLELKYIDIGGGFFGGMPSKPSFNEYFSEVKKILKEIPKIEEMMIIVEPGASLIASPFSFVSSVIDVKKTNRNIFVVTDGSRNDIDPLMTKKNYICKISCCKNEVVEEKQVVSGFTCMENDRLFELMDFQRLSVGDRIRYSKVGSYTMCLSPLFIKYYPDIYTVDRNGKRKIIRNKWTWLQYIQNSVVD